MVQDRPTTIQEAASRFLLDVTDPDGRQQAEVLKFVRWSGNDRRMAELKAHDVNSYAEAVAASGISDPAHALEPVKAFLAFARKEKILTVALASHVRAKRTGPTKSRRAVEAQRQIELTTEGRANLETELTTLTAERPKIAEALRQAMADKDYRENAPLDAAREHQGQVEARIRDLEATLRIATTIGENHSSVPTLILGSTVVLRELETGEVRTYRLVNPTEARPTDGKLSVESPTGKAVLGHGNGDEIVVVAPAGTIRYRVEKIER